MHRWKLLHHAALSGSRLHPLVGDLLAPMAWNVFVLHVYDAVDPLLGLDQLNGNHTRPLPFPEAKITRAKRSSRGIRVDAGGG